MTENSDCLKFSVVATTYNDQNLIDPLLDNLLNQTVLPTEIVIADGGSTDQTVNKIENYRSRTKIPVIILSGKRLNISQGLNAAIKVASCEYLAVTGTGNIYHQRYFEELCNCMKQTEAEVVYPPIRGQNNSHFSVIYNRVFLRGDYGIRIPSNHGGLIKRTVFEKIGLFYENFIYAGEDTEFYDRARNENINMICAENAIVLWDTPRNWKEFNKQIKNYTIANMQISGNLDLVKQYLKIIVGIMVILLASVFCFFESTRLMGLFLLAVILTYIVAKMLRSGIVAFFMNRYMMMYQIYIILQNRTVLCADRKVNLNTIEFL